MYLGDMKSFQMTPGLLIIACTNLSICTTKLVAEGTTPTPNDFLGGATAGDIKGIYINCSKLIKFQQLKNTKKDKKKKKS